MHYIISRVISLRRLGISFCRNPFPSFVYVRVILRMGAKLIFFLNFIHFFFVLILEEGTTLYDKRVGGLH
jgi:hypothetical protein